MAAGENRVPENLKKQLAIAVRSIQWSYAIFWSVSATQPGVLEWGDGYYNGDIKTRKTIQAVELKADQLGLQRSEQLRELYGSLSAGESTTSSQQARRSSAALSPEDLTDTEWYYLVCMSFVFNIGEGMPGRTLVNGEPSWLSNAHTADSKVFSRSLLAKSASIRTVVCFPFLGGVVELGTTEHVMEDLSLIQCVKTSFLETPYPLLSEKSDLGSAKTRNDKEFPHQGLLDPQILDNNLMPVVEMASPTKTSNIGFDPDQEAEDSFMVEGINGGGASQVQSWQFIDDEFSNCVHHSLNSSDCISQTFVEPSRVACIPRKGNAKESSHRLREIQEHNRARMTSLDLKSDDLHYQSVLSTLFKTTHQLILGPHFQNCDKRSSFTSWKKGGSLKLPESGSNGYTPQRMLKKILFEVPRMHQNELLDFPEDNGNAEIDGMTNHMLAEKKRREKLNERFNKLRSIVPSISKVDKVSILDETIEYLQELERRVEELESCKEPKETNTRTRLKKSNEAAERNSANCGNTEIGNGKKTLLNKRKASDIEEAEMPETDHVLGKDGSIDNLTISTYGNEVVIELKCGWREGVLLEIMDVVSGLNLDSHSVQSSTCDGYLCLTVKCQHKGAKVATAGTIEQALQRVAWKH